MIPVTILTGYLGSGKTTLLARLLKSPALARTAVIINEFGAVGLDHDLVEAGEESFIQLETGCLCCAVRGDLEATLADLLQRRADGRVPAFERVVIETSGLADPAPVLQAMMLESGRSVGIVLGRLVTTVDAVTGLDMLSRELQPSRQVAAADCLVVTKTDLLDAPPAALFAALHELNPGAEMLTASFGAVDPALLLASPLPGPIEWMARLDTGTSALGMFSSTRNPATRAMDFGGHDHSIAVQAVRRTHPIRAATLPLFLEALAHHCGDGLLRLKGIVGIAESPDRPAVVHGVQHLFHAPAWLDRWPTSDRTTRLVLIGRGLSGEWTERLLEAIEAEVAEIEGAAASRDQSDGTSHRPPETG